MTRTLGRYAAVVVVLGLLAAWAAPAAASRAVASPGQAQRSASTGLPRAIHATSTCPVGAPAGAVCVTIPCSLSNCATIEATPTAKLQDGEAVNLTLTNFTKSTVPSLTPTNDVNVLLCTTVPTTLTCSSDTVYGADQLPSVGVVALDHGHAELGYRVESDPPGAGAHPLLSALVQQSGGQTPGQSFFCDNGPARYVAYNDGSGVQHDPAGPCAVVVTIGSPGFWPTFLSSAPPAVFPVTFSVPNSGCPLSTPTLTSENAWTLDRLIPTVNHVACTSTNPVVDIGLSTDSESVASAVARKLSPLGFTDDPEDPIEQASLATGHFALVPVAATATVMAFTGVIGQRPTATLPNDRPLLEHLDLTPNDVAGLLTGTYRFMPFFGGGTDTVSDAAVCGKYGANCSLLQLLNSQPKGYLLTYEKIGNYLYADAMGASSEATSWFCAQPADANWPVTVNGAPFSDPNVAAATFEQANPYTPVGSRWPITHCQSIAALGPDLYTDANGVPAELNTANSPDDQATEMQKWVANNEAASDNPKLAFGLMDSSQADFFGYPVAALQNAPASSSSASTYSLPTAASVDAAINEASTNPNGTLAFNFYPSTPDSAAYPMPMITYAIVPTTPQPPAQAALMRSFLLSLLSVTGGSETSELPSGYYPLPTAVYTDAVSDIGKDIVAGKPGTPPPTTPPGTPSGPTPGGGSGPGLPGAPGGGDGGSSQPGTPGSGSSSSGTANGPQSQSGQGGQAIGATPGGALATYTLNSTVNRVVLICIAAVGLACLIAGPLLLTSRRRSHGAPGG